MLMITNTNAGAKLANGGASIVVNADGSETLAPVGLLTLGKIYYAAQNGLAAALTAAGSNGHVVVVDSQAVTTALTVPAGATLEVKRGGLLTFSGSGALVVTGTFEAGCYQTFAGNLAAVTLGKGPHAYPEWWGADHSGVADAAPAINAMITATCPGDPTAVVRNPTRMWVFHGWYKLASEVQIFSVLGAHLRGIGPEVTRFIPQGQANALNIDGSCESIYEGFSVEGGSCTNAVNLHWSGTYFRSTENNHFRDIAVQNGCQFVTAFAVGTDTATDVSGSVFDKCVVGGGWTAGNVATYQNGFLMGNGTTGNVLCNAQRDCQVGGCRYGVQSSGSNVEWYGGLFEGNGDDVLVGQIATGAPYVVQGVRSEASGRLLDTPGGASEPCVMALRDVGYSANGINADNKWINWNFPGTLILDGVTQTNPKAGSAPIIQANGVAPGQLLVVVDGLTVTSSFAATFPSFDTTTRLVVHGFATAGATITLQATDAPSVLKVSAAYTATLVDSEIVADMTAAAYALTLPAANSTPVQWRKELRVFIPAGANVLTFTPSGADTIVGPTSISGVGAWARLVNDSASKWYVTT